MSQDTRADAQPRVDLPRWDRWKRDWLWIVLLGLAVQALWAVRLTHPSYMDAYYYTTAARELAAGRGLTTQVIWQYLDDPAGLPAPSHTYWMPLPSLLAAAGYLLSDSFRAAQAPFWLLAGLLPWLSFVIAGALGAKRWEAWAAALFTAWGGYYAAYLSQPTTFAPYAWAGGLGLLVLGRATAGGRDRLWLAAGLLAGLAHLTRADGLLFLLVGLWLWLLAGPRRSWRQPAWLVAGYLLMMGPWLARNLVVLGRPLPTAGTQTIFLTQYDDLFAYGRQFNLAGYVAWGAGNIVRSKLEALWLALQTFLAVSGLVFLAPFILLAWIGWGRRPGWPLLRPLTWASLGLLALLALVFTFPSGRGSVLHASAALWTWMMALAAVGIGRAVDWAAARRTHWRPARAGPVFAGMFVVVALVISLITSGAHPLRDDEARILEEFAAALPPGSIVMLPDAPMYFYHTGNPAINVPNEPPAVLLEVARRYGAGYLVLDSGYPHPLAGVYEDTAPDPAIRLLREEAGIKLYVLEVGR